MSSQPASCAAIRAAKPSDLGELGRIYASARAYMHSHGNPDQWTDGYPQSDILSSDIARRRLYIGVYKDVPRFAFMLMDEPEPTYAGIDGAWPDDEPYSTLHRVASDGSMSDVFTPVFGFAAGRRRNIRIDTHRDNLIMQRVLTRHGFVYCGIIVIPGIGERLAYQYTASKDQNF